MGSLLQTLADDCRDGGANVAFTAARKITVRGDIVRLRRLFTNLLENAIKFGNRVALAYDRDGEDVVVDFVDDGPGMAEEDLPRAFDPFFRGERSRNRSTGGIGLGLAIAESAARAHDGTIELRNVPGGFRARVRLPMGAPIVAVM
ncbi:ATP-binding protein [bacterium]|nr:MAG: ATP-binding protein [bacterium]